VGSRCRVGAFCDFRQISGRCVRAARLAESASLLACAGVSLRACNHIESLRVPITEW
jgi:hypothetical protein